MDTFFVFSDEYGDYSAERSNKFKEKHPFYIRSAVLVESGEYKLFEKQITCLKSNTGLNPYKEIKWSHIGDIQNAHQPEYLAHFSIEHIKKYIKDFLEIAATMKSLRYIFTITDNSTDVSLQYEDIISQHIQWTLQRVQMDLRRNNGYGVIIIDDLDSKNKQVKEQSYRKMCAGDFVTYDNLNKSILIDYSHQCVGLQLADIVVGAFSSALIRETRGKKGYPFAGHLYEEIITKNIRNAGTGGVTHPSNPYATIGYGLIDIPRHSMNTVLSNMEHILEQKELERLFS